MSLNGVPLTLNLTVVQYSSSGCSALQDAQVDVWHADAGGVYSDESVENTLGETYLRGYQVTDAPGLVTFKTIFPGAETSALARATARQVRNVPANRNLNYVHRIMY